MCCGYVLWQVFTSSHNFERLKTFLSFLSYLLKGVRCERCERERESERERERDIVKFLAEFESERSNWFQQVTEKTDFELGWGPYMVVLRVKLPNDVYSNMFGWSLTLTSAM